MIPSRKERKKQLRSVYRRCRDKENSVLQERTPKSVVCEDESIRSYNRKRLAQCFETPPPKRAATNKSHSPDFSNVSWDKEAVLQALRDHPPAPPPINWTQFAKSHNIPGSNCGQIAKEFAQESGIDVLQLDRRKPGQRVRMRKRRLHGGEVSVPTLPTASTVKKSWRNMVESGQLSLGIPCAPFTLTHYVVHHGELVQQDTTIHGRKFPLKELRQKLLQNQEPFMRLSTDEEIQQMSLEDLHSTLQERGEDMDSASMEDLRTKYKNLQRSRTLALWHDHATILGLGMVMLMVHVVYDSMVFLTQSEYTSNQSEPINIQSTVELPVIHLLAAGTSSVEDQASILQDRIDCIKTLSEGVTTSNGIEITDQLLFFVGDHPAKQFERGTQMGGKYKCGSCGVKSRMMDDLAHTLQLPHRGLADLQQVAIEGQRGRKAGDLKPFSQLKLQELQVELNARQIYTQGRKKDELEHNLKVILKGVHHVPTLLLLEPTASLTTLNLEKYTVLDCEPLHDVKGHFINLTKELPFLLQGEVRQSTKSIISACVSDKMTCADHRVLLIQLYLHLKQAGVDNKIILLIQTAVQISRNLYLPAEQRNP